MKVREVIAIRGTVRVYLAPAQPSRKLRNDDDAGKLYGWHLYRMGSTTSSSPWDAKTGVHTRDRHGHREELLLTLVEHVPDVPRSGMRQRLGNLLSSLRDAARELGPWDTLLVLGEYGREIIMLAHISVPIARRADVGAARGAATQVAAVHHIDEATSCRVALIAAELAANLLHHTHGGRLLIGCHEIDDGAEIEVISIDAGPGIPDVNCLRDGRSSPASIGGALIEVRQLSTDFSMFSMVGRGTVLVSRAWSPAAHALTAIAPSARFSHAGICVPASGPSANADAWDIRLSKGKASVVVSTGTSPGLAGTDPSALVSRMFRDFDVEPDAHLQKVDELLHSTRGAAVAAAELDALEGTVVLSAVGGIACRIVSASEAISFESEAGIFGDDVCEPIQIRRAWPERSVVVLHSKGLSSDWNLQATPGLMRCDPAVIAGWLLRDHASASRDVTIIVMKRN